MVYFWIPNLIGYSRVIFACVAFGIASDDPWTFFFFYGLSQFMDALDGHAARYFDQTSEYGAVLDMVTDRCSTAALLFVLGAFYPKLILLFMALNALDLTSHYAHLKSSSQAGVSHKVINDKQHWMIQLYYGNRKVLFALCAFNELMFLGAYLLHFTNGPIVFGDIGLAQLIFYISLPGGIIKQGMNAVQMCQAFADLAANDLALRKIKKK